MLVPVTEAEAKQLLAGFRAGEVSAGAILRAFQAEPVADLGFAQVDLHRALRKNFPEVVFGSGKTPAQVAAIAAKLVAREQHVLVTRITADHARVLRKRFRRAVYHEAARCVTIETKSRQKRPGVIAVLCAGTSDLPVAEEAQVTAEAFGCRVDTLVDVGVAGAHRLFAEAARLQAADVLVVVAGMEGALPSLVAGMVAVPVVAVPTSVGYGAAFEGLAALLSMLNSCAVGVSVVNIDNGFGAGALAARIVAAGRRAAAPQDRGSGGLKPRPPEDRVPR
jgi:hypothetical protein